VIADFGDQATEDIYHDFNSARTRRFSEEVRRATRRKLMLIAAATTVQDLRVPPGNRLEQLRGDMAGRWSVRVNDQWRIVFRWADGTASDVRLTDYH
jgi:proteic killer suppression protein